MKLHVGRSGGGPSVFMLHGTGFSSRQWKRLVARLEQADFTAITVDLVGHGASPPLVEPTPHSFHDDVRLVGELLVADGRAHLVGHSYGGLVALGIARAMPERVLSMALYEPVAFGALDPERDEDARADLDRATRPWGMSDAEHEAWLASFVGFWRGPGAWESMSEPMRAECRRVGWAMYEGVRSLLADRTPASAYAGIACPVQLFSGAESPAAARRVVERLVEQLPHVKVTTLADAGHMAPITHAAQVADAIVATLGPSA